MPAYLSPAWIEEAATYVAADPTLAASALLPVAVTQVVTGGPTGDIAYHFTVADGEVTFGPGPAPHQDVCIELDHATAVALATGGVNAQEAFVRGRIGLHGDHGALLAAVPVLRALDAVLAPLRAETTFS